MHFHDMCGLKPVPYMCFHLTDMYTRSVTQMVIWKKITLKDSLKCMERTHIQN